MTRTAGDREWLPVRAACRAVGRAGRATAVFRAIREGTYQGEVVSGERGQLVRPEDVARWIGAQDGARASARTDARASADHARTDGGDGAPALDQCAALVRTNAPESEYAPAELVDEFPEVAQVKYETRLARAVIERDQVYLARQRLAQEAAVVTGQDPAFLAGECARLQWRQGRITRAIGEVTLALLATFAWPPDLAAHGLLAAQAAVEALADAALAGPMFATYAGLCAAHRACWRPDPPPPLINQPLAWHPWWGWVPSPPRMIGPGD